MAVTRRMDQTLLDQPPPDRSRLLGRLIDHAGRWVCRTRSPNQAPYDDC